MIAAAVRADKTSRQEKRRRRHGDDATNPPPGPTGDSMVEPVARAESVEYTVPAEPTACGLDPHGLVNPTGVVMDTMAERLAALTEQVAALHDLTERAASPTPPQEPTFDQAARAAPPPAIQEPTFDPAAQAASPPAPQEPTPDRRIVADPTPTKSATWWGPMLQTTTLEGVDGTELDAEAVLQSADVVLLYCTASWCPPCRAFTPALVELYEEQENPRKIEVVLVSRDQPGPAGDEYRAKMPWPSLPIGGTQRSAEILAELGIKSIPTLIGFDNKTGKCITRNGVQQAFQIFGRYA